MIARKARDLHRSWLILLALTLAGMAAAGWMRAPAAPLALAAILLFLSVVKARLVVLDFLGMRAAPAMLRRALLAWPAFFALAAAAKALVSSLV